MIKITKHHLRNLDNQLLEVIYLHPVKGFELFPSYANDSIEY